jgi:hypothetical protein
MWLDWFWEKIRLHRRFHLNYFIYPLQCTGICASIDDLACGIVGRGDDDGHVSQIQLHAWVMHQEGARDRPLGHGAVKEDAIIWWRLPMTGKLPRTGREALYDQSYLGSRAWRVGDGVGNKGKCRTYVLRPAWKLGSETMDAHEPLRASPTVALNFSGVKIICSALDPLLAREAMFTSNKSSKFWALKNE